MWADVRGLWAGLSSTGAPWALSLLLVPLILSRLPNRWGQQVPKRQRGFQGWWGQPEPGILPLPTGCDDEGAARCLGVEEARLQQRLPLRSGRGGSLRPGQGWEGIHKP